jgi:hypothetical protein
MKKIKFKNEVMTADAPNVNGLTYPREVLEKAVADVQERVENGQMLGELNSTGYSAKLGDVSHQVTSLKMEGDKVVAEVLILDTPAGKILQELVDRGENPTLKAPKLSPVGKGDVNDKIISNYSIGSIHVDTTAKPAKSSRE